MILLQNAKSQKTNKKSEPMSLSEEFLKKKQNFRLILVRTRPYNTTTRDKKFNKQWENTVGTKPLYIKCQEFWIRKRKAGI